MPNFGELLSQALGLVPFVPPAQGQSPMYGQMKSLIDAMALQPQQYQIAQSIYRGAQPQEIEPNIFQHENKLFGIEPKTGQIMWEQALGAGSETKKDTQLIQSGGYWALIDKQSGEVVAAEMMGKKDTLKSLTEKMAEEIEQGINVFEEWSPAKRDLAVSQKLLSKELVYPEKEKPLSNKEQLEQKLAKEGWDKLSETEKAMAAGYNLVPDVLAFPKKEQAPARAPQPKVLWIEHPTKPKKEVMLVQKWDKDTNSWTFEINEKYTRDKPVEWKELLIQQAAGGNPLDQYRPGQ